jgi:hypothetical protein
MARWTLDGDYFENCSCDILCPCLLSHAQAAPTNGECNGALAFHVDKGSCDSVDLSGLNAAVLFSAKGPMANGNWTVALYLDEKASDPQRDALLRIFSGSLGGPPAAIAALAGKNLGAKSVPMRYTLDRKTRSFQIPGLIDMNVEAIPGADDEVVWIENVAHPVARRLSAARGTSTSIRDHGFSWDNTGRNGHFAPFRWSA